MKLSLPLLSKYYHTIPYGWVILNLTYQTSGIGYNIRGINWFPSLVMSEYFRSLWWEIRSAVSSTCTNFSPERYFRNHRNLYGITFLIPTILLLEETFQRGLEVELLSREYFIYTDIYTYRATHDDNLDVSSVIAPPFWYFNDKSCNSLTDPDENR